MNTEKICPYYKSCSYLLHSFQSETMSNDEVKEYTFSICEENYLACNKVKIRFLGKRKWQD